MTATATATAVKSSRAARRKNKESREIQVTRSYVFIANNFVEASAKSTENILDRQLYATLLTNLAYYGYTPSKAVCNVLSRMSKQEATTWWIETEDALREITGDNRKMGDFVVYKNFPGEVLEMSQADYWFRQILMYVGFPNELFTADESPRDKMFEKVEFKVLHLADDKTLNNITNSLIRQPTKWTENQFVCLRHLMFSENIQADPSTIPFKENMVRIVALMLDRDDISMRSSTDVLRLAVAMSDGSVRFDKPVRFRKFSRKERRFFLRLLEKAYNSLEEDMGRRPGLWKQFMVALHPGDYASKCPHVVVAYDRLYRGNITTFNSVIESMIEDGSKDVLSELANRPGDFMRRLVHLLGVYGSDAATAFIKILPKLTNLQLVKTRKMLETANSRKFRMFAPKGNWSRVQIVDNDINLPNVLTAKINRAINKLLAGRLHSTVRSVNLNDNAKEVKLQTNDSSLTHYGRGTVFHIPDNVDFIRTASYWKIVSSYCTWYDNGWNFFDEKWNSKGACCWNLPYYTGETNRYWGYGTNKVPAGTGAVFSGDPTNTKEMEGRACQMIDLYPERMLALGVRYAVWNILCFSRKSFDEANDVYAALQWGENANTGKLFEPSRCKLSFPVRGDTMTKYICLIDFKERKLVYMDANLKGSTSSAGSNCENLQKVMPAYVEYMDSLPSVHDLFKSVRKNKLGTPVVYSDAGVKIKKGKKAYVFQPVNPENSFKPIDVATILASKE